jgi:hypothetical protein
MSEFQRREHLAVPRALQVDPLTLRGVDRELPTFSTLTRDRKVQMYSVIES